VNEYKQVVRLIIKYLKEASTSANLKGYITPLGMKTAWDKKTKKRHPWAKYGGSQEGEDYPYDDNKRRAPREKGTNIPTMKPYRKLSLKEIIGL